MSRHTSNQSASNDGSWFLEAVGAKEKSPTPIESVERLEQENTTEAEAVTVGATPEPASATFDGDPGTSTSSFHPVPAPPPPPDLEHPGTATDTPADTEAEAPPPSPVTPDDGPDDDGLPAQIRSRRNFRWPIVIGLLLAIGAVIAAAVWLPRSLEDDALAVRQAYYDAAADLRNHLPTAQQGLDAITNPASGSDEVSASVPVVAELDTKAFALEAVTAEPLPAPLPLIPTGPVDALEPLQVRGNVLGVSGTRLAGRLGDAYVYRTAVPTLLDTGSLPLAATTQEVNELSVRLASSLASDAGVIADLPDDPDFAASRGAASAAVERYAPWQDEYLAALGAEDADAAAALVSEMDRIRAELAETVQADLLRFRSDADAEIVALAAELERYLADITRG